MRYLSRVQYSCGLGILIALAQAGMSPPSSYYTGPMPPVGWEKNVVPGFEPSIESVLVSMANYQSRPSEAALAADWESWGAEGVHALLTLVEQEEWAPFTEYAEQMLFHAKHPVALEYFVKQIRPIPVFPENPEERARSVSRYTQLCFSIGRAYGDDVLQDLQAILESRQAPYGVRLAAMQGIRYGNAWERGQAALLERASAWAESAEPVERFLAASILLNLNEPASYAQAKAIAATLKDTEFAQITAEVEYRGSSVRANEPMSVILEKEKAER